MEFLNLRFGKNHIFKRSILLIKAWSLYDARILASSNGCISSYALEAMIAHILNCYYNDFYSPIDVFKKFIKVYSEIKWDSEIVTIFGIVSKNLIYEFIQSVIII